MPVVSLFQTLLSIIAGIVVALVSGYIAQVRENQRWVKEEVYRPLYDEIASAAEGNLPREGQGFGSKWDDVDRFQRFHVDKGLRQALDDYAGKLQSLSDRKEELEGSEELLEILPEGLADTQGSDIVLVNRRDDEGGIRGYIEVGDWLEIFSGIIIEAENPTKMRERLIEYSEENGLGHERNFRKWDKQYPDWQEKFWEAFRGGSHESIDSVERVEELKADISEQASELRDEIEGRIKEGFVAVLIRKAR